MLRVLADLEQLECLVESDLAVLLEQPVDVAPVFEGQRHVQTLQDLEEHCLLHFTLLLYMGHGSRNTFVDASKGPLQLRLDFVLLLHCAQLLIQL